MDTPHGDGQASDLWADNLAEALGLLRRIQADPNPERAWVSRVEDLLVKLQNLPGASEDALVEFTYDLGYFVGDEPRAEDAAYYGWRDLRRRIAALFSKLEAAGLTPP